MIVEAVDLTTIPLAESLPCAGSVLIRLIDYVRLVNAEDLRIWNPPNNGGACLLTVLRCACDDHALDDSLPRVSIEPTTASYTASPTICEILTTDTWHRTTMICTTLPKLYQQSLCSFGPENGRLFL